MDELLRAGVPEIKLALGEVIDRENARPLPPKYARLLPETVLRVTLRADAAEALQPIAADLERELTNSCNRHGSLYDRIYRVQLQRSDDPDSPLYSVISHSGAASEAAPVQAPAEPPESAAPAGSPRPAASPGSPAEPAGAVPIPLADPDSTRISFEPSTRWDDGRWVLIVEGEGGDEREVFRLGEPVLTVGRSTDDPKVRPNIGISDAPHVSRRQLALAWEERDGAPGFGVYNLGLNTVHLPGRDLPGARAGKGELALDRVAPEHVGWVPPGVPLRIGDHGPILRIEEIPPDEEESPSDPDATVFE